MEEANRESPTERPQKAPFPWHLGVYDAHCHPTDSMKRIASISTMKARTLTIMATRSQDQHLVSEVATNYPLSANTHPASVSPSPAVLPSFGWHPWFSHQIYNDLDHTTTTTTTTTAAAAHQPPAPETPPIDKQTHYNAVLTGPSLPLSSALLSSLPTPRALSSVLAQTRRYLSEHPGALVGEIGLDRTFRVPEGSSAADAPDADLTPGGREGRRLSAHRVDMRHQRAVLAAQLRLAGELGRAVSVHGVAAHGAVFDTLRAAWAGHERPVVSKRSRKRWADASPAREGRQHRDGGGEWREGEGDEGEDGEDGAGEGGRMEGEEKRSKPFPPRICLHSYSGPPEALKQYLDPSVPADVFFSFSRLINFSTSAAEKAREVIRRLPEDRILVESDLHCAGERMDGLLEEMVREVCELRGWGLEDGVRRLGRNWRRFALGEEA